MTARDSYYVSNTVYPFVVAYSFNWEQPLHLSESVTSCSIGTGISSSTTDTATIELGNLEWADWLSIGDYIQISLVPQHDSGFNGTKQQRTWDQLRESVFFGRIVTIDTVLVTSGHIMKQTLRVTIDSWGKILTECLFSFRIWMALYSQQDKNWQIEFRKKARSGGGIEAGCEVTGADIPLLAKLIGSVGKLARKDVVKDATTKAVTLKKFDPTKLFMVTPRTANQLLLHMFARYGGPLQQSFLLPKSYDSGRVAEIPFWTQIARICLRRLNSRNDPVTKLSGTLKPGTNLGKLFIDNDDFFEDEFKDSLEFEGVADVKEALKNMPYYFEDWHYTMQRQPWFDEGCGRFDEVMQWKTEKPLWTAMTEYSDPVFMELFCSLTENLKLDHGGGSGSSSTIECHDGVVFERKSYPSLVLRPRPQPTFGHSHAAIGSAPASYSRDDAGHVIVADHGMAGAGVRRSAYRDCMKCLIDINFIKSVSAIRGRPSAATYWQVKPEGFNFQGGMMDAAWLGYVTDWRTPLIDDEAMNVLGWREKSVTTKFWLTEDLFKSGQSKALRTQMKKHVWDVIIRKSLILRAWTAAGVDLLSGQITIPLTDPNVPRPGDVLYIVGAKSGLSAVSFFDETAATLDRAARDSRDGYIQRRHIDIQTGATKIEHAPFSEVIGGWETSSKMAVCVYVESVSLTLTHDQTTGISTTACSITYSNGRVAELGKEITEIGRSRSGQAVPYARFMRWGEVGVNTDPIHWLPAPFDIEAAHASIRPRKLLDEEAFWKTVVEEVKTEKKKRTRRKKRRRRAPTKTVKPTQTFRKRDVHIKLKKYVPPPPPPPKPAPKKKPPVSRGSARGRSRSDEGRSRIVGRPWQVGPGGLVVPDCWVAEVLFGVDDVKTHFARAYTRRTDNWFTRLYRKHGIKWAEWAKKSRVIRFAIRPIWLYMARRGRNMFERGV
jgi:hypothetical protein